ncbi:hypothetical protein OFB84_34915, partial [Escherichia coli]|nr:hypothetical protein [Escherichia coli]
PTSNILGATLGGVLQFLLTSHNTVKGRVDRLFCDGIVTTSLARVVGIVVTINDDAVLPSSICGVVMVNVESS